MHTSAFAAAAAGKSPPYEAYPSQTGSGLGFTCIVRVNNREYQTESACASEVLARESAAMRAYLICRNFSVSDGMIPAGHSARTHGGAVQGIPVAIGTGRKARDDDDTEGSTNSSACGGSWSGGSSPERMMRLDRELQMNLGLDSGLGSSSGSGSEGGFDETCLFDWDG
ncbi:hypothetical protein N7454_008732 [Penicillium verhagenii]|nr:hypothetical protein N7454_008732 [Penicillium verhagenii]